MMNEDKSEIFFISDEKFRTKNNLESFYQQNSDLVEGVRFVATLQFSTCLRCAALDGYVWHLPIEKDSVRYPPMHLGCRCIMLPVTDFDRFNSSTRPAEAVDFLRNAEARYAKKYPGRDWNRLAPSTRWKYYYAEQRAFEEETGHPAFDQVPQTMNFSEWLHTKPDDIQDRYLGELRGRLFRRRNLNLIDFVDRSTWALFPQKTLLERYDR